MATVAWILTVLIGAVIVGIVGYQFWKQKEEVKGYRTDLDKARADLAKAKDELRAAFEQARKDLQDTFYLYKDDLSKSSDEIKEASKKALTSVEEISRDDLAQSKDIRIIKDNIKNLEGSLQGLQRKQDEIDTYTNNKIDESAKFLRQESREALSMASEGKAISQSCLQILSSLTGQIAGATIQRLHPHPEEKEPHDTNQTTTDENHSD